MKKVIGVGASVLDTIIEMDSYPVEDAKIKAENVFVSGGGPVSNALVCLSKFGIETSYLGLLSNDSNGRYLFDEFRKYNVGTDNIRFVDNTKTFTSFIILNKEKGTRTCLFHRGNIKHDSSLVNLNAIKNFDILHLDGNALEIAIEAAKVAKKAKVLVSLDAGTLYPGIEELLPYVDIFIASENFAETYAKEKDIQKAIMAIQNAYHPKVLVVTTGKDGGYYVEKDKAIHYDSYKVDVVDSNGAGDTFHGAFLYAYLQKMNIKEACQFASATSAIKCQKAGVRQALPTKEEVIEFMNKYKEI